MREKKKNMEKIRNKDVYGKNKKKIKKKKKENKKIRK